MFIPLEIVRAGKAEEYASAFDAEEAAKLRLREAQNAHYSLVRQLYKDIDLEVRAHENSVVYAQGSVWKRSLIIEELGNQILQAAGEIIDSREEYHKARNQFAILNEGVKE